MTVEKFLSFWNTYNTAIIEGLIALIIFLSLFLAYRSLFGKKGENSAEGTIDSAQIEKTLQKILENQSGQRKGKGANAAAGEDGESLDMEFPLDEGSSEAPAKAKVKAVASAADGDSGGVRESAAEVAQLRLTLTENQLKIESLQEKLEEAEKKAQAGASGSEGAATSGGVSSEALEENTKEREALKAKLKDLEARLAEYEIISEDIADLSRYKEENESLKKELSAKGGGVAAETSGTNAVSAEELVTEPVAAAEPEAVATLETPEQPEVTAAPVASEQEISPEALEAELAAAAEAIAPVDESEKVEAPAATANSEAAPAVAEEAANDLIDDELMREFAAAVEGQKNASAAKAAEKAGDGSTPAEKTGAETDELMNEFENFVAKKS